MHRKIRKALAVLLAVTMALIPTAVFAAEDDDAVTAGSPSAEITALDEPEVVDEKEATDRRIEGEEAETSDDEPESTAPANLVPVVHPAFRKTLLAISSLGNNTGLSWEFDSNDGTLTIAYDENSNGSGIMPDYTETSRPWYSHINDISSLVIEEGVKHIGEFAFYDLPNLSGALIIPEGVTSIGSYAFGSCYGLTGVLTIPDSVTSIDIGAFENCSGFNGNLTISSGLIAIPDSAFRGCSGLISVTIPDGITSIGTYAFSGCANTEVITFETLSPDTITTLGSTSFGSLKSVGKVYYPEGAVIAEYETFLTKLKSSAGMPSGWILAVTATTYTISYSAGGGSGTMEDSVATDGMAFTLPACTFIAPAGKEFKAWEIDGTEYAVGDTCNFTADTTVTAVWMPATYTVSYVGGSGSGSMTPGKATAGVAFTLPACTFTAPTGKEFKAWEIGGSEYAAGASYTFTADTAVTAVWVSATYTVSYVAGGGSGSMAPGKATAGVAFTLPACTFTAPAGKEFKAWKIGSNEYAAGASYTFTANTTVTAVWKNKTTVTYTVSYAGGSGSGSMAPGKATAGVAFTLPACTFTAPAGMEFKAWKIGSNEYAVGAKYTFTANTTVTAVWKNKTAATYIVTYAAGGGSGSMANGKATAGVAFTLPACTFTAPTGMEFKAWKIGSNEYAVGAKYTFTANTTVTAVWKDKATAAPPENRGSVGGSIYKEDGGTLAGVNVKVMHGGSHGTVIDLTTTNGSGEYRFASLPYGIYSLVAEYDGVTVTKRITVDRDSITQNITMFSGKHHTVVEVVAGTPSTAADNLDDMFTSGDHAIMDNNGSVALTLKVQEQSQSAVSADATLIEGAASDMSIGMYLDLALLKTITDTAAQDVANQPITQTETMLTIVIELPEALWGKTAYSIIRVHNGNAEKLAADYNDTFHTLTFQTDRFSTYAVAYTESGGTPTSATTNPQTGDNSNMAGWLMILVASAAGLTALAACRWRQQAGKQ